MKDTYLAYRAQKAILETIQANIEETFADYTGEEEVWKVIQYDDPRNGRIMTPNETCALDEIIRFYCFL